LNPYKLFFKATTGYHDDYLSSEVMMLAAIGLLIDLGVYVYLGSKVEHILLKARWEQTKIFESKSSK